MRFMLPDRRPSARPVFNPAPALPAILLSLATVAVSPAARAQPESATPAAASAAGVIAAVRHAADDYATAFNAGDTAALADQWTLGAELDEAGGLLKGREAIVASLGRLRAIYPKASLAIDVTDVQPLGEGVARVQGTLAFTRQPGEEPAVSRFESLRVSENGRWRIAESRVVPSGKSALADLGWMIGRWQSTDAKAGTKVEATYERALGGHAIVGRIKTTKGDGSTVDSLDVIQADRRTGRVRSWTLDSTGSHAEGEFTTDGTSFNRSMVAAPGDPAVGDHAEWVQVLRALGPDKILWHSIERSLDGRSLPDTEPVHLKKIP